MTIGTHTVYVMAPDLSTFLDLSPLVESVAVHHGRDDATTQPVASVATVDLDLAGEVMPADVDIGCWLGVTSGGPTRFWGKITDVDASWVDAGTETPNAGIGRVMAAATLADLGRTVVGDEPWPDELDGARVGRVLALAVDIATGTVDPGTMVVLARDVDSADALSIITETAESASGMLWQTRDGLVSYADADHRRNLPSMLTLDSSQIDVAPSWSRTLQGMINEASVGYGVPVDGADQDRVVVSSAASIARYGRYAYSVATSLATVDDATMLADLLVARGATPVWIMDVLPVAVDQLTEDDTAALLNLEVGDLITLTGLPVVVPDAPSTAALWVEGWSERLAFDAHTLDLVVSGYCRTVPPPQWDDLPAGFLTTVVTATNLLKDPSMWVPAGGWAGGVTYAGGSGTITANGAFSPNVAAVAGSTFTGLWVIHNPTGAPITMRVKVWGTAAGLFSGAGGALVPVTVAAGGAAVVRSTGTLIAGDNGVRLYTPDGIGMVIDGVMIVAGSYAGDYFDGDTADAPNVAYYQWTGAVNASTSTRLAVLSAAWTWDSMPATLTWDGAACIGVLPTADTWANVAASTRWDSVPAAVTWDDWTTYTA